jgi:hypothetical protein
MIIKSFFDIFFGDSRICSDVVTEKGVRLRRSCRLGKWCNKIPA